jgi:CRP/FNR family transcriptional regulator, cyclic AMP receptor protein
MELTAVVERAQPNLFEQRIRDLFRKESFHSRTIRVAKHAHIYTCGDRDEMIYWIESGQVKLTLISPEGKECLLAIHTAGEIVGELALCGQVMRMESATAMTDATLRKMPCRSFLALLNRDSMLEGMVEYLAARISEQQTMIRTLVTTNSEPRLAITLLRLGRRLGKPEACATCINQKISHEELAGMVGTTRPRIGVFLKKFRQLGMIELNHKRCFIIKEKEIKEYLDRIAYGDRMIQPGTQTKTG